MATNTDTIPLRLVKGSIITNKDFLRSYEILGEEMPTFLFPAGTTLTTDNHTAVILANENTIKIEKNVLGPYPAELKEGTILKEIDGFGGRITLDNPTKVFLTHKTMVAVPKGTHLFVCGMQITTVNDTNMYLCSSHAFSMGRDLADRLQQLFKK